LNSEERTIDRLAVAGVSCPKPAVPGDSGMQRREALRLLAASAALPLFSRDALALFQEVHDQLPETAALKVLNPHQNATVIAISETIIPQTDTPGAKATRVNEFIDAILAGWYDEAEKNNFLSDLAQFDVQCRNLLGKDFVECSGEQQTQFLRITDDEIPEIRERAGATWAQENAQPKEFFARIKQLTLVGYYTSQVGFEEELHAEIIPARHAGCAPLEGETAK
jgi:Gluconate 2-dehydrogenase subunit 3